MNKIAKLMALVLCFAATEARADFQLDEIMDMGVSITRSGFFGSVVRPYRDRTERFQSARKEALQMSLAINDESDRLTMEGWGDNRADIRGGGSRIQGQFGKLSGDSFNSSGVNTYRYPGDRAGAYGRFGTIEAEYSRFMQETQPVTSGPTERYERNAGGAGLSFGYQAVRLGLHGNVGKATDDATSFETRNNSAGGALALAAGPFELGATLDYVDRGMDYTGPSPYGITRRGPSAGGQAIIKLPSGLKGGLRASLTKLSGEATPSFGPSSDFSGNNNELGARAEWAFSFMPLTVAASYDMLYMDPEFKSGASKVMAETRNNLKTLAAAFRPFGGRVLIGAEISDLGISYETFTNGTGGGATKIDGLTMTGGAELWLLPGFAVRGSYQKMELKVAGDEGNYKSFGGGVGLKGDHLSLDGSVRRFEEDRDNGSRFTDVRLMLGYKF
jgi:hypothetical protein